VCEGAGVEGADGLIGAKVYVLIVRRIVCRFSDCVNDIMLCG
jgi:hypothetical protein